MKQGDHLVSVRIGYSHHGLYIGHNRVIHYSGSSLGELQAGVIEIIGLEAFCQGNGYSVKSYPFRTYDRETSIERAKSRLGEDWYNVLLNNCEHFVAWCILGVHSSDQVNELIGSVIFGHSLLCEPVKTTVLHTGAGLAAQRVERHITKQLASMATSSTIASTGITTAGLTTGVISSLTATTLSSIALPVIAGSLVAYGALKLLNSIFDE